MHRLTQPPKSTAWEVWTAGAHSLSRAGFAQAFMHILHNGPVSFPSQTQIQSGVRTAGAQSSSRARSARISSSASAPSSQPPALAAAAAAAAAASMGISTSAASCHVTQRHALRHYAIDTRAPNSNTPYMTESCLTMTVMLFVCQARHVVQVRK